MPVEARATNAGKGRSVPRLALGGPMWTLASSEPFWRHLRRRCGGMLQAGDRTAASALLIGLAVSILPILLRVLPPLRRHLRPASDLATGSSLWSA